MKSFVVGVAAVLSIVFSIVTITCTGNAPQSNRSSNNLSPTDPSSLTSSATSSNLPLRTLRDVPLSGGATRFDYQSFDPNSGRLYIAHLGDGVVTVFDANKETVVGDVKDCRASTASLRSRNFTVSMLQPQALTNW